MNETSTEQSSSPNEATPVASVWISRLLVIVAAVLWSTSGFFAKAPIFNDWPLEARGSLMVFWRAVFASAILILMVRSVRWSWRMVPMTLIFAAMNWTYLTALTYCEATLAIWTQYTAPVWVFIIGLIWLREKSNWRDWALLALSTIGVAVIVIAESMGANKIGLLFGLGSGLCFGGVVLSLRVLRDFDSAWLIFLNHAVTAIIFAPVVFTHQISPQGQQWIYLIAFGALQMGIPYVLFARAVQALPGHEASGLSLLEPVLVPVWVFVAWRNADGYQFPAATTLIGGALILAGLIVRYLGERKSAGRQV